MGDKCDGQGLIWGWVYIRAALYIVMHYNVWPESCTLVANAKVSAPLQYSIIHQMM